MTHEKEKRIEMNAEELKKKSKFLSLVLRHEPDKIGIALDEAGWVEVDVLMVALTRHGRGMSRETLNLVVETNDKQRFIFNADKTKIRANQGHSVEVDLSLTATMPPEVLYHGTVAKFLPNIRAEGLKKMERQHVQLSKDIETATKVGNRRGTAMILHIQSGVMHKEGYAFYLSENGVWLTDNVPARYIEFNVTR